MHPNLLSRTIGSASDVVNGVRAGLYQVCGGVVRVAKGHEGAGQIVAHLLFPNDEQQASKCLQLMQQGIQGSSSSSDSLGMLQSLQLANTALSGLNLAVSAVGFVVVCKKLNSISDQLTSLSDKLDLLTDLAIQAQVREQLRDTARFRATVKTILQFAEEGDIDGLKGQIHGLHEQYEYTTLILKPMINSASFGTPLFMCLYERTIYLSLLLSFIHQKRGNFQYAIEALHELHQYLKKHFLDVMEKEINADGHTVASIVAMMRSALSEPGLLSLTDTMRGQVLFTLNIVDTLPAIEYQASLLEFIKERPLLIEQLDAEVTDVRVLLS